ncbi:MAG TPA: hypothetical protein VKB51_17655 [bacterium]|nr:hypothetical protein [bacterium]
MLLGAVALLAGCGGGNATVASGSVPATLSFSGTSGTGATGLSMPMATLANGVGVDTFRFGVSKIELHAIATASTDTSTVTSQEGGSSSGDDNAAEFKGDFIVDLIGGTIQDVVGGGAATSLPSFLPAGSYEELDFKLTPEPGVDTNAPTTPVSLLVAGSYTSPADGLVRNYSVTVSVPFQVEIDGPNAVLLDGSTNDLIVALHLDALLSPANLDALLANTEITTQPSPGVYQVTVDASTSPTSVEQLRQMIKSALDFGEDHNGDHELEAGEDVSGQS